eukprot:scaffold106660_cov48-Phaeocystis_antarctica.AAC.1
MALSPSSLDFPPAADRAPSMLGYTAAAASGGAPAPACSGAPSPARSSANSPARGGAPAPACGSASSPARAQWNSPVAQEAGLDGSPRPSSRGQRGAAASPAASGSPTSLASGSPTSRTKDALSRSFQVLLFDDKEQQERRNAGRRPSLKEVDKWAAAAI